MELFVASIVGAFLPAVLWLLFLYTRDRYEPEPKRLILGLFVVGMVIAVPVAFVGEAIVGALSATVLILLVGPIEEAAKYLAAFIVVRKNPNFNEPVDGMLYLATVALGFAALETTTYILRSAAQAASSGGVRNAIAAVSTVGLLRGLYSIFGHVSWSGMVGYFLARHVLGGRPQREVAIGILAAGGLHTLFDFTLLLRGGFVFLNVLVWAFSLGIFIWLFRRSLRASPFRTHQLAPAGMQGLAGQVAISPGTGISHTHMPDDPHSWALGRVELPADKQSIRLLFGALPTEVGGGQRVSDDPSMAVYGSPGRSNSFLRAQPLASFAEGLGKTPVEILKNLGRSSEVRVQAQGLNPKARIAYLLSTASVKGRLMYTASWARPNGAWVFSAVADGAETRSALIAAFTEAASRVPTVASAGKPDQGQASGRTWQSLYGSSGQPDPAIAAAPPQTRTVRCPKCGHQYDGAASFCGQCGAPLIPVG